MTYLTTSGACVIKAGANVNSLFTGTSANTEWNTLISGAQATLIAATRKNWVTDYPTLTNEKKLILDEAVSSLAAIQAIAYDTAGYTSLGEAQTKLDVLRDTFERARNILEDKNTQDFIV